MAEEATHKKYLLVRQEGNRNVQRNFNHYNLDMIIAFEEHPMHMADWIAALDNQILALQRRLLEGKGTVSHKETIDEAERKFNIYRQRKMSQLESDCLKEDRTLLKNNQVHFVEQQNIMTFFHGYNEISIPHPKDKRVRGRECEAERNSWSIWDRV